MILKIQDAIGCSHIFDEIDYCTYEDAGESIPLDKSLDLRVKGSPARDLRLLIMNKNQTAMTEIFATSPIYLLNNNGKTIERL